MYFKKKSFFSLEVVVTGRAKLMICNNDDTNVTVSVKHTRPAYMYLIFNVFLSNRER